MIEFKFGHDNQIFLSGQSWGGYLGTAFLITGDNENKVESWINIDGGINRNQWIHDRFIRIPEIANEQIAQNNFVEEWTSILVDLEAEKQLGIIQYSTETENNSNKIMGRGETILANSDIIYNNVTTTFEGVYSTNYHPFISIANSTRDIDPLINQIYTKYDDLVDANLSKLTLPVLSIYGKYDIRTPVQQGAYLMEGISTPDKDKKLIIVDNAGHTPMRNNPDLVATEMINWIEKYK